MNDSDRYRLLDTKCRKLYHSCAGMQIKREERTRKLQIGDEKNHQGEAALRMLNDSDRYRLLHTKCRKLHHFCAGKLNAKNVHVSYK